MPDAQPPPHQSPLDLAGAGDPAAAFVEAHRAGRLLVLRTSGTAGTPHRLLRTTDSWLDSFAHVGSLTGIGSTSTVWVPGPLSATMNLFAAVHADWAGARLVPDLADATHAHLTPSRLRQLLATRSEDLAGAHLIVAGDRLESPTYDAARAAGAEVSHYYGAAELSFVAWGPHAEALREFPGVEIEARDGELWVRSPYVASGLVSGGSLRCDDNGWTTVGDRGEVADGLVLVHGRAGGVTTGGATVLVADIEDALRPRAHGLVVVTGVRHPDLGEVVAAVLTDADDVGALRSESRRRLDPAQQPRLWFHLPEPPLTENQKVDRAALREVVTTRGVRL